MQIAWSQKYYEITKSTIKQRQQFPCRKRVRPHLAIILMCYELDSQKQQGQATSSN